MPRSTDARAKALATAEHLFRTQGFAATGLTQIIETSGSPKGSFYFHFPGGKDELASEVIENYGARGRALIEHVAWHNSGNAPGFVRQLCAMFASEMRSSNFTLGCAIQNIAAEKAPMRSALNERLDKALASWTSAASSQFELCGLSRPEADRHAVTLIAALEGARTIARIQQSDAVFNLIADTLVGSLNPDLSAVPNTAKTNLAAKV